MGGCVFCIKGPQGQCVRICVQGPQGQCVRVRAAEAIVWGAKWCYYLLPYLLLHLMPGVEDAFGAGWAGERSALVGQFAVGERHCFAVGET